MAPFFIMRPKLFYIKYLQEKEPLTAKEIIWGINAYVARNKRLKGEDSRELAILRNAIISLHTARWTGNHDRVVEILEMFGAYSYAMTNSTMDPDVDERLVNNAIEKLNKM